ncbi:hypothetical protein HAX54_020701, partial [Datura stramonium]|nr:hypothetical protein [Datura stramonium]
MKCRKINIKRPDSDRFKQIHPKPDKIAKKRRRSGGFQKMESVGGVGFVWNLFGGPFASSRQVDGGGALEKGREKRGCGRDLEMVVHRSKRKEKEGGRLGCAAV